MKYWSKLNPKLTAEVPFDVVDPNGGVPAQIFGATWDDEENGEPVPDPFYAIIKLDEWSPVPLGTWDGPSEGFLMIDDDGYAVEVVEQETDAKARITGKGKYHYTGYVPVQIRKHAMIERKS